MNNTPSFPMKLLRSLYDISYYAEVLKHKTSKAVTFALLIALFFGSLSMIRPLVEWNRTIDSIIQDIHLHLSPFTISEGVLTSTSKSPYALNMNGLAVVVDPASEETTLQAGADFGFYFTKTKMIIRNGLNKGTDITYKDFLKEDFGKEDLKGLVSTMKLGGWFLIPLGGLYGIVMVFISATITMFFGRVVYAFSRKALSYRDSFVVAIHAQVLTAILYLLSSIFLVTMPLFYPLCLMMMGLYYINLARWEDADHS